MLNVTKVLFIVYFMQFVYSPNLIAQLIVRTRVGTELMRVTETGKVIIDSLQVIKGGPETGKILFTSDIEGNTEFSDSPQAGDFFKWDQTNKKWVLQTPPSSPTGPQGAIGPEGTLGSSGPTGSRGTVGPRGTRGLVGITGPRGTVGPQGMQGPTGPTGAQGTLGPQGARGTVGTTGPRGTRGIRGTRGPAGPIGTRGTIGPRGTRGLAGPIGPTGTGNISVYYNQMRIICVDFDGTTVRAVRYKDGDATGFDSDCSGSGFTSTSDYTRVSDTDGMFSERGVLLGKNLINNSDNNRVAIHVNLSLHGDEGAVGFLSGLGGGSAYSKQVNVKVMPGSAYHSLSGISSLTSDGGVYFMSQYQGAGAQIDDMVIGIYGHQ